MNQNIATIQKKSINRLDTHDRLSFLIGDQHTKINEVTQEYLKECPFGEEIPFYLFATARTRPDQSQDLIWQPRLTKPTPAENSVLLKLYPRNQSIKVFWIIPRTEFWSEFLNESAMFFDPFIAGCIMEFTTNKFALAKKEDDDFDDERINEIYRNLKKIKKEVVQSIETPEA